MANTTNLNLEKPIGTDQALVSVINSNMDKIDTFAGSTNQALSNMASTISTGSMHDIKRNGLFYLTNAVTDKPTSTGGYYSVVSNGSVVSGLFVQNSTGNAFAVSYDGTTWTYKQIAFDPNTLVMRSIQKSSTVSTAIKFTYTGNRYNVLLFVTDNVFSNSGIHAITYKSGSTPAVTRLNGSGNLPTIDSDGSISIAVNAWSTVTLLTEDTNFS